MQAKCHVTSDKITFPRTQFIPPRHPHPKFFSIYLTHVGMNKPFINTTSATHCHKNYELNTANTQSEENIVMNAFLLTIFRKER